VDPSHLSQCDADLSVRRGRPAEVLVVLIRQGTVSLEKLDNHAGLTLQPFVTQLGAEGPVDFG
jgi:hypothetical protein